MFGFGKKRYAKSPDDRVAPDQLRKQSSESVAPAEQASVAGQAPASGKRGGLFRRPRERLSRGRDQLGGGLADLMIGVPIRFTGVGGSIDDLRPFAADELLDALLV